jgi:glycosyltransferase involved in cell wall biosynthesis
MEIEKNDFPLITIGIPCFNAEATIARAIESAQSQTYSNLEILVVDDCSTDNSCNVIQSFLKNDKRINFLSNSSNQGPGYVRNRIVNEARGDYIAFFDDDDESLPERIECQWQRIQFYKKQTGENLIACYASGKRIYPNNYTVKLKAIGSNMMPPKGEQIADYLLFYKRYKSIFYGTGTPSCSLMAEKKVFLEVSGFDPELRRLEDVDFAIRLSLKGGLFIGCPEKLFNQYSTSAPDKSAEKNLEAEQRVASKYQDYLEKKGRFEYASRWPLLRYYHFKRQYLKLLMQLIYLFIRYPFAVTVHVLSTFPQRFLHERKMIKKI